MNSLAVHSKALLLLAVFWNEFLPWYVYHRPVKIVKYYLGYAKVSWRICSVIFLLKTLFAPWKNIGEPYPDNKLDIAGIAHAFSMNMIARGVGACVRILTIIFGLAVQVLLAGVFLIYFITWLLFPVYCLLAIPYLLGSTLQ